MIDVALLQKKLAFLASCVSDLRTLARPERLAVDVREERFVEHTLQLAIQAMLDVASHVVSEQRLGEPETNRALFDALARDGWVDPAQLPVLRSMAGFRNILVHGYTAVDVALVAVVLRDHLGDLEAFSATVQRRLIAMGSAKTSSG
jgi:uncharacterized protein YutE (UPF0331/DUF86 family)